VPDPMDDHSSTVLILILVLYFLPTIIAGIRGHRNQGSIFVLNLFLGWTFLGWVISLAMAVSGNVKTRRPRPTRAPPDDDDWRSYISR